MDFNAKLCEFLKKLALSSLANTSTRGNFQQNVKELKKKAGNYVVEKSL